MRWLGALVLVLAGCSPAPLSQPIVTGPVTAFVGVNVLTPGLAALLEDQTVLVQGDGIIAIGPTARIDVRRSTERIDGSGKVLMPGLVDAHVHLEYFDDPAVLGLFLANGVTSVRNMDGRPHLLAWRDSVARGAWLGPTIYTAGPILDGDPPLRDDNLAIADAVAARAAVAEQHAAGYDFIKLYVNLDADAYRAAIAEATARGLPAVGHVARTLAVADAIAAGQHAIEHLDAIGEAVEAEDSPFREGWHWSKLYVAMPLDTMRAAALATRLRDAGIYVVPTAVQADRVVLLDSIRVLLAAAELQYVPASLRQRWDPAGYEPERRAALEEAGAEERELLLRGRENRLALIRILHRGGVRLAAGSDTPNDLVIPGFSLHDELANFVAAGLEPQDALAAATRDAAALLRQEHEFGTIEVGQRADLLLLEGDPRESLAVLRRPAGVMVRGRWLPAARLQALLEQASRSAATH